MKQTRRKFILGSAAIVGSTCVLAGGSDDVPVADTRDMVYVPGGTFTKGLTVEQTTDLAKQYDVHPSFFGGESGGEVHVEGFYIDRYPVTNRQYKHFIDATDYMAPVAWAGLDFPAGCADVPVVGVNCEDAEAYCKWAGKRLPSEEEWEKAARGTDGRFYPWGNQWKPGKCRMDSAKPPSASFGPAPVGSYPDDKSPYGVMDMAGNVEEWVSDGSDRLRLTKGGSFVHSQPYNFLCARRFGHHSVVMRALDYIGFRCAKTGDGPRAGSEEKGSPPHGYKNLSSGSLPPIEVGKYLKEPIWLSTAIHGNLEEFIRLGVVNIMSLHVPYFPGDQFMVWLAEGSGKAQVEWSADGRSAIQRGDNDGRQVEVRVRGEMDSVDILYTEKNTSSQPNKVRLPNNCFNPLGAPNFCDHEGSRTFMYTDRGFQRINELPYDFSQGGYMDHSNDFKLPMLAIVSRSGDWVISESAPEAFGLWNNIEWSCLHAPLSYITMEPGQEVVIHQKIYFLRGTLDDLLKRWGRDFGKAAG